MGKISSGVNVVLIIIILVILLIIFTFKGYAQCACTTKFNNETQAFYSDCPTTGTPGQFWMYLNEGVTGICG